MISADGSYVTDHTTATNLFRGATGVGNIVRADVVRSPAAQVWVSHPFGGGAPNGSSDDPTADYLANLLFFDSEASNIHSPGFRDTNGAADIFIWGANDGLVKLRSTACNGCDSLRGASTDPVRSYVANYTLFTHGGQLWMRYIPK